MNALRSESRETENTVGQVFVCGRDSEPFLYESLDPDRARNRRVQIRFPQLVPADILDVFARVILPFLERPLTGAQRLHFLFWSRLFPRFNNSSALTFFSMTAPNAKP